MVQKVVRLSSNKDFSGYCICFLPVQSRIKEQRLQPLRTRWIDVSLLFDGDSINKECGSHRSH